MTQLRWDTRLNWRHIKGILSACAGGFTPKLVLRIGNQVLVLLASALLCSDVSAGVAGNQMSHRSVVCANKSSTRDNLFAPFLCHLQRSKGSIAHICLSCDFHVARGKSPVFTRSDQAVLPLQLEKLRTVPEIKLIKNLSSSFLHLESALALLMTGSLAFLCTEGIYTFLAITVRKLPWPRYAHKEME